MKATLCITKVGNGYKIVVSETWLYASKKAVAEFLEGKRKSVVFNELKN